MQHGSHYTLRAISDPANFNRHYPAIAVTGREFLRGWPGIGTYRFVCGDISADGTLKSGEPVEA